MADIAVSDLVKKHCVPCEGGTAPFTRAEEEQYLVAVPQWQIDRIAIHKLSREVKVKNFKEALGLVNAIGEIAEAEGHHPNLCIHDFRNLKIELYTHAIGGLSINDFVLAAKINKLLI